MPETNINQLIEDAVLIRPDQKETLLPLAPNFTQEQTDALSQIIGQEPDVVEQTFNDTMQLAVEQKDGTTVEVLSELAKQAAKIMKREEEANDRKTEEALLAELESKLSTDL